jgi:Acyl dehydratase
MDRQNGVNSNWPAGRTRKQIGKILKRFQFSIPAFIGKLSLMTPKYFEDYELNATRETTGRTITEADIVLHAGQTGDFYPHHMDAEWCKTQPFGQRIAHGTLIFSIAVGMTAGEINPLAFSYGYDRLRFIKPVFIGDTIRSRVTIREKRDHKKPGFGVVVEALEVLNQRSETVLACEHLLLVEVRKKS